MNGGQCMDNIWIPKEDIMLLSENKTLVLTEREKRLVDMAYKSGYRKGREDEKKYQEMLEKEAHNSRW
jgi:hypothetical protein